MDTLLLVAAHNTVVAFLLALLVSALTRVWRNPPAAHVLWLVVLLKLVAPPIAYVDWPMPARSEPILRHSLTSAMMSRIEAVDAKSEAVRPLDRPTDRATTQKSTPGEKRDAFNLVVRGFWNQTRSLIITIWLGGAALGLLIAAMRIEQFRRLARDAMPAPDSVRRLTSQIATELGVRQTPDVRYLHGVSGPFVWWIGRRPTIFLPVRLRDDPDLQSMTLILTHELAHLRRYDHWVRPLELFVSIVYWWNPLAWMIRRQIHQAEDLCCDAWVRSTFPDRTKRYAEVLLETAESFHAFPDRGVLPLASPFLRRLSLKGRIEMVLESRFAPQLSWKSRVVILTLAVLVLPLFARTTVMKAGPLPDDGRPGAPGSTAATTTQSDFPYAVPFEQGATRFKDGDSITIVDVRGTSDKFQVGNIYLIKGRYALNSHPRAMIAAYTTAKKAADGTGTPFKAQSVEVGLRNGTFTLFLPMSCEGWPHVSFYPVDGGESFGGNYFGTGKSVLKRWWDEKETHSRASSTPARSVTSNDVDTEAEPRTPPTKAAFPFSVPFEQGATRFLAGDSIAIDEVRGTADRFAPNNTYLIKGRYTLASHDRAKLSASITAVEAALARSRPLETQSTVVDRGEGRFTLVLPMSHRGLPHLSFYPAERGGSDFGGNYFGTGDSVLKQWWGSKKKQDGIPGAPKASTEQDSQVPTSAPHTKVRE